MRISQLMTLVYPWGAITGREKKEILEFWELTTPQTKALSHVLVLLDNWEDVSIYFQLCHRPLKWKDNIFSQKLASSFGPWFFQFIFWLCHKKQTGLKIALYQNLLHSSTCLHIFPPMTTSKYQSWHLLSELRIFRL